NAGQLSGGTEVAVGLEELAQGNIRALFAKADRRAEGALQYNAGFGDGIDGLLRHAGWQALLENSLSCVALLPLDFGAGGFDDPLCCRDAFRPNTIAGNQSDKLAARFSNMEAHGISPD